MFEGVEHLIPVGTLDVEQFLEGSNGNIELTLIDAGMLRPIAQQYRWEVDVKADTMLVTPVLRRGRQEGVTIPRKVALTPHLVAFFGMYDGDGNKTNQIGFAGDQRLQQFTDLGLRLLFADAFETEVTLLEDSLYFEGAETREAMAAIRADLVKQGRAPAAITERELQERVMLAMSGRSPLGPMPPRVRFVISPKKGARRAGKSSFEIIHNRLRSKYFLPLLLALVKECISTINANTESSGALAWDGPPHTFARQYVDTETYLRSGRARYVTTGKVIREYELQAMDEASVWMRKPGGKTFAVRRRIALTPLLSLMFGLYLAEGTTAKPLFFTFHDGPADLSLGFNSSEDTSLRIFLKALEAILVDVEGIVAEWLVKIGTKYFPETTAVGEKLGVPIARGGPKGQGRARAVEVTAAVRDWAIGQFPTTQSWADAFTHIEFTGAGIPRVDVRCRSYPAPLIFSLIRDMVFFPALLRPHLRATL